MSELSERSGVPVATVKYYLREDLLPSGTATGRTRAAYDGSHVARLRLIRALVDVAGLSLDRVRGVLAVVDDPRASVAQSIGSAHLQLSRTPVTAPTEESRARMLRVIRKRRWRTDPDQSHAVALAAALDVMDAAGQPLSDGSLDAYAAAAASMARVDLAAMGSREAADATTYAVIGTLLTEPVITYLRRMAQENLSRRRLARTAS